MDIKMQEREAIGKKKDKKHGPPILCTGKKKRKKFKNWYVETW